MIQRFILFIFFYICIAGCQDTVSIIEDPGTPNHHLQINGDIQFHSEISWSASNNNLNTQIWVENVGTDPVRIEAGPCSFNVIAYNKNSEPVWYNRPPNDYICPDELLIYEIAPKETKQLDGQMYITGQNWYWDIPAGDWTFVIESSTEKGESISFSVKTTKML